MSKKEIKEKEVVVEEENILESNKKVKATKDKNEKSLFSKIVNIVLWVVLFAWMAIVLVDYYLVTQEKEPAFCISTKTTKYEDGNVESCTGLGYKAFRYKRKSYNAIEFGPFWASDRSAKIEK